MKVGFSHISKYGLLLNRLSKLSGSRETIKWLKVRWKTVRNLFKGLFLHHRHHHNLCIAPQKLAMLRKELFWSKNHRQVWKFLAIRRKIIPSMTNKIGISKAIPTSLTISLAICNTQKNNCVKELYRKKQALSLDIPVFGGAAIWMF